MPLNLTKLNLVKDLNYISQKSTEFKLKHEIPEHLFIFKLEMHLVIIYMFIVSSLLVSCIVIFRIKSKIIKMYKPEVADNQSSSKQEYNPLRL